MHLGVFKRGGIYKSPIIIHGTSNSDDSKIKMNFVLENDVSLTVRPNELLWILSHDVKFDGKGSLGEILLHTSPNRGSKVEHYPGVRWG